MTNANELFNLKENQDGTVAVSGRELHEGLEVETRYNDWIKRMLEYGFEENIDYILVFKKRATAQGNQTTYTDHIMTLDMALAICSKQEKKGRKEKYTNT